jgi:hypothetical protein
LPVSVSSSGYTSYFQKRAIAPIVTPVKVFTVYPRVTRLTIPYPAATLLIKRIASKAAINKSLHIPEYSKTSKTTQRQNTLFSSAPHSQRSPLEIGTMKNVKTAQAMNETQQL